MPDEVTPKTLRAIARARKHPRKCHKCGKKLNSRNRERVCFACMPNAAERSDAFNALDPNGPHGAAEEEYWALLQARADNITRSLEGRERRR